MRRALDLLLDNLREALPDMSGLPRSLRLLVALGYAAVLALLAATLGIELLSDRLATVAIRYADTPLRIPVAALGVASAAFALGWAFVLTGASDCRRRVFLPVIGLFAFQLVLLAGGLGPLAALLLLLAVLLAGGVAAAHAFTGRSARWRNYPGWEFAGWLALGATCVALVWAASATLAGLAESIAADFALLMLLTGAYWALGGVEAGEAVLDAAGACVRRVRRRFGERGQRLVAAAVLALHPLADVALLALGFSPLWGLDLLAALALGASGLALAALRRLSHGAALTLLSLSLVSALFTFSLRMAISGDDLTGMALAATGIFPPLLLFIALMLHGLLSFGARFASVEGRAVPRQARVLLYLGASLLVGAFVVFFVNLRDPATGALDQRLQGFINSIFFLSFAFLGTPYMLWQIWRRGGRLEG